MTLLMLPGALRFIKNIVLLTLILTVTGHALEKSSFKLSSGETIQLRVARTLKEKTDGLSGIKDADFKHNEAILFIYQKDSFQRFWMPNTFFNLDIFFLDKNFLVLDVHRDLQHFRGKGPRKKIPTSKTVFSRHVLEMKAASPLSKKIKKGIFLKIKL